jgi:hypothetical protein
MRFSRNKKCFHTLIAKHGNFKLTKLKYFIAADSLPREPIIINKKHCRGHEMPLQLFVYIIHVSASPIQRRHTEL